MPQLVTLFAVGGRADSQLGVKIAAAVLLALPVMIAFSFSKAFYQQYGFHRIKRLTFKISCFIK